MLPPTSFDNRVHSFDYSTPFCFHRPAVRSSRGPPKTFEAPTPPSKPPPFAQALTCRPCCSASASTCRPPRRPPGRSRSRTRRTRRRRRSASRRRWPSRRWSRGGSARALPRRTSPRRKGPRLPPGLAGHQRLRQFFLSRN